MGWWTRIVVFVAGRVRVFDSQGTMGAATAVRTGISLVMASVSGSLGTTVKRRNIFRVFLR